MRRALLTLAATSAIVGSAAATVLAQSAADPRAVTYGKLVNTVLPTVEFNGNDFRNVLTFLSEVGDVDIITKWDEDGLGDGFDPAAEITLTLNNPTALVDVLELVMDQASEEETTWNLGAGYVEVGTKDQLNTKKYVVLYPVRELLFVAPRFDDAPELDLESVLQSSTQGGGGSGSGSIFEDEEDEEQSSRANEEDEAEELIDIITSIVEPNQWENFGGEGGSIRYFRGFLIVNAADYLHRQVGGYPFAPARVRNTSGATAMVGNGWTTAAAYPTPRYVTLTGDFAMADIVGIERTSIPILVGGRVIDSGDGDGN